MNSIFSCLSICNLMLIKSKIILANVEPYKKHAKSNSAIPMPVIDKKILEQSRENLRKVVSESFFLL